MAVETVSVLIKATRLLDVLAESNGGAVPLAGLAAAAALPPGTAARLLRTLERLGWADHAGPRGGYRLGPRVGALSQAQRHRQCFFSAAAAVLPALAEEIAAPITVSMLRGCRRCLLHQWTPSGCESHPALDLRDDLWATASGRILAARQNVKVRRYLLRELGSPGRGVWSGVATCDEVRAELAWIRRHNLAISRPRSQGLAAAAMGVVDGEGGQMAVGFYIQVGEWDPARVKRLAAAVEVLAQKVEGESRPQPASGARPRVGSRCNGGCSGR